MAKRTPQPVLKKHVVAPTKHSGAAHKPSAAQKGKGT